LNVVTIKNEIDARVPIVPDTVKKLLKLDGVDVFVEKGISKVFLDQDYIDAGATLGERAELLQKADIILGVSKPLVDDLAVLKPGTLSISFLDPFNDKDYLKALEKYKISAVSLEMIPRTTLAQKMDAVSSQASLAGYTAVITGADQMNKVFPMMMTPAGTITPAKVFIIGAGVAGLQAIATAKRLGARVVAFDTRPVVKEQVESLGGKFLEIDLGETGQTKDGYAKALTKEQLEIQQAAMTKSIQDSDLVITTAKLFARKAPIIIKKEVLKGMKHGSVIVDLAASTGGNVEGTELDKVVEVDGVKIIGHKYLPARVTRDASNMFSNNLANFIAHFWNNDEKIFDYSDDEILTGCLVTKDGEIVNERVGG
jgi:NAD(P) transhydrogenase subunit alpha